ncbi:MAG: coproporphyrinogen dehydrogenase HemZ [Clostridiales bacterium]|nr:coproporphyrinogen dehydrogenase HemZ [Clostridiales bacterium]
MNMDYFIKGHSYGDDIISILQLFYPNGTYKRVDIPTGNCVMSAVLYDNIYAVLILNGGKIGYIEEPLPKDEAEVKKRLKLTLFKLLMGYYKIPLPWGALTGVRPAKLVSKLKGEGHSPREIVKILKEEYFVRDDKIRLCMEVSDREEKILKNSDPNAVGLYVGIPFCPTRCLYCSFTSYPLDKYKDKIDSYLDCLEKEMEFCGGILKDVPVESVYIGGGTPTSLDERRLKRLLTAVLKNFNTPSEFTVEAGRPDTITKEKLEILKDFSIDRISINPQTLNDKTLELIGRHHKTEDFYRAFELARAAGIGHINCDIILGLPGEGEEEVINTFEGIKRLSPESLTVHTLAVKRASRLKETLESFRLADFNLMDRLLSLSGEYTAEMGLSPYYMYRQKNMVGNFENVSCCKPNHECIYNIQIMEETQTIIAMGCGGSTKTVDKGQNRIERIFNVKSVDDYIARIDEMIDRKKKGLKEFIK